VKVQEITDQDTVAKLFLKIKKAYRVKTGQKASEHLTIILEDGKKITMYDKDKNSTTKLYTQGINRFSKLRYYDKPKENAGFKGVPVIQLKYGDYMKFLDH